jgi:hypothetical protein
MSTNSQAPGIAAKASQRGITEILHFSTNLGLTGSLHHGALLPRNKLRLEEQLEYILTLNSPFRSEEESWFDKTQDWISFINLSVSEITTNLFRFSLKWHQGKDIYWVILSFGVEILDHPGVFFTTTNNIYPLTIRASGIDGFKGMFADPVFRKSRNSWVARRFGRAANLTTCEQAEVLYPGGLPLVHLKRVYVRSGEDADRVYALLSAFDREDVEVTVDAGKFSGKP